MQIFIVNKKQQDHLYKARIQSDALSELFTFQS